MTKYLQLTPDLLRAIFPRAPQAYLDALLAGQDYLDRAGITETPTRLGYCFANVEHETDGFTIRNLTESILYTPERAKVVWPSRARQIDAITPQSGPLFQRALMNAMYGNRMGNRPGTDDGARYIGRGGPQITGRDGYAQIALKTGLPLVDQPELACLPENQAKIIAAYVSWKGLNAYADRDDFSGYVTVWNGGHIGYADRQRMLAGNDPFIARLKAVERITRPAPAILPASPVKPPAEPVVNPKASPAAKVAGGIGALTVIGLALAGAWHSIATFLGHLWPF